MKRILAIVSAVSLVTIGAQAQILLSGGLSYGQDFNGLANSPAGSTVTWTDGSTLPGWYASRAYVSGTTSAYGPFAYPAYRVGDGSANAGTIYSFGVGADVDRALGSISSGTPRTNVFGVLVKNDTSDVMGGVTVSYTGEQWRNGGNTAVHSLDFSYQVSASGFASPIGVESAPDAGWTAVNALSFNSPTIGATAALLDGNAAANRTLFSNVVLPGVTLNPGDSIFLRWLDIDNAGSDHALAVDDFSVSFAIVPEPTTAVLGGFGLLAFALFRRRP